MGCGPSNALEVSPEPTRKKPKNDWANAKSRTTNHAVMNEKLDVKHSHHDKEQKHALRNTVVKFQAQQDEDINNESIDKQEPRPPKLKKEDLIKDMEQFKHVDNHARKAPSGLRNSLSDLVKYLCKPSPDHLYQVRAFYVWIADNIRYDCNGFFGRTEMASGNPVDVLKTGLSVCEGYARLMAAMCSEAGIKATKVSGYSKGYGYSPEHPVTTKHNTDHAWNAVYLRDNWFLIDNTWGAGHLDKETNEFKKKFDEFYFLTDPQKFVYSHFPYMDDNMNESMKWQLLQRPWNLDWFNRSIKLEGEAFEIGVLPKSHKEGVVSFDDELEITFSQDGDDNEFSATLYQPKGNMLYEVQFSTHVNITSQAMNLKIKPPESGEYRLRVFGRKSVQKSSEYYSQLFEYVLHCKVPREKSQMRKFPYPKAYPQAFTDKCQVLQPLGAQIPAKTEIKMRFKSPYLKRMMINKKMLNKVGDLFEGSVMTPDSNYLIRVYGSRSDSGTLDGQFDFCVG